MASTFTNPVSSNQIVQQDIFGASFDSTVEIYSTLTDFATAGEDGTVVLPSGQEIDVNTLTGMTTTQLIYNFCKHIRKLLITFLFSLKTSKAN